MRQILGGLGLIVATALGAYPAFAQDSTSANFIMPGCRDYFGASIGDAFLRGYCLGLVEGAPRYAPGVAPHKELLTTKRKGYRPIHRQPTRSTARKFHKPSNRGATQDLAMPALAKKSALKRSSPPTQFCGTLCHTLRVHLRAGIAIRSRCRNRASA
jgi:hypothetical protein